jgi:hypothetical protein
MRSRAFPAKLAGFLRKHWPALFGGIWGLIYGMFGPLRSHFWLRVLVGSAVGAVVVAICVLIGWLIVRLRHNSGNPPI